MEVLRVQVFVMSIITLALTYAVPSINAQVLPPAPVPTSDGIELDQGVAYVLMLLALVLTYLIH
ncbi:Arabinogalactan peptide 20 [Mucuna pruriens]|uniref:Arabinogalactan peptide 20 n=1 Tax=Mucuna pruriens TaxID=157652 RepID=A0A371HW04_MUCPR|nr:Arabinogalactan peptide 20 [Mucuna pruriens]